MTAILATVSLALSLLAACAPAAQAPAQVPAAQVPAAQSADASCAARGGTLQPVGRLQRSTCVTPYADAGKTCSDKTDCQGACIAEGNLEAQGATTGQCQKTNVQFGCYARIVNGKATAAICVD
jgi:putative hemolysin